MPLIERPSNEQRDEERKEFGELFVNLDDDSDTESLDFVPKKKTETEEYYNFFFQNSNLFCKI